MQGETDACETKKEDDESLTWSLSLSKHILGRHLLSLSSVCFFSVLFCFRLGLAARVVQFDKRKVRENKS